MSLYRESYQGRGVWESEELPSWTPLDGHRSHELEMFDIWVDSMEPWIDHISRKDAIAEIRGAEQCRRRAAQVDEHSRQWWSSAEGRARAQELQEEMEQAQ